MVRNGSVVVGWTVNARRVVAGLSATTVASHVPGGPVGSKNHVHCGSTAPVAACTRYSASPFICASSASLTVANPVGVARPTTWFDIVTPNASAPVLTEIEPGSAIVEDVPAPEAEWWLPRASALTELTPLHAESSMPPSAIEFEKMACTARIESKLVLASGKLCTFVAT